MAKLKTMELLDGAPKRALSVFDVATELGVSAQTGPARNQIYSVESPNEARGRHRIVITRSRRRRQGW